MTGEPAAAEVAELTFRRFSGEQVHAVAAVAGAECPVGDLLTARDVTLDDGTELRQVRVAPGQRQGPGYEHLDNEILAGRRLHDVTESVEYPDSLSFLYGDEADSAAPCALLKRYQGQPLKDVIGQLLEPEQHAFEASLLQGLCWLAAAGIAHLSLSPATVRWDSRRGTAQITDFSTCTVFGAPRTAARPGGAADDLVTARDDMYTAGLLIYYVRVQGEGSRPTEEKLAALGLTHLAPLFGPPEGRPTAAEVLTSHIGAADPVPRRARIGVRLADGYSRFGFWWEKKNPERSFPADPRDGAR
jgi:hypothetical protein